MKRTIVLASAEAFLVSLQRHRSRAWAEDRGLRNKETAVSNQSFWRPINLSMPGIKRLHATHTNESRVTALSTNWKFTRGSWQLAVNLDTQRWPESQVRTRVIRIQHYVSKNIMVSKAFPQMQWYVDFTSCQSWSLLSERSSSDTWAQKAAISLSSPAQVIPQLFNTSTLGRLRRSESVERQKTLAPLRLALACVC